MWNYETINWTSGSPTDTGKRVISVHGEKGDRGIDGKAVEYIFYRTNSKVNLTVYHFCLFFFSIRTPDRNEHKTARSRGHSSL